MANIFVLLLRKTNDEIVMIMEATMMLKLMCTLSCRISGTQGSQCLHFWQNFHICTMVFEHYSSSNFLGGFDKGIAGNLFLKCGTEHEETTRNSYFLAHELSNKFIYWWVEGSSQRYKVQIARSRGQRGGGCNQVTEVWRSLLKGLILLWLLSLSQRCQNVGNHLSSSPIVPPPQGWKKNL